MIQKRPKWRSSNYETNEIRAEVTLIGDHAKSFYDLILQQKDLIETELGYNLYWYNPENAKNCRIYIRQTVNLQSRSNWNEQHQWLLKHLEDLHKAFAHRIRHLTLA